MKNYINIFLLKPILVIVALGIFSCGSGSESSDKNTFPTYQLSKIDSFEVNNLTRVIIRDYSPEEKRYLGYAMVEDELLEISESGEIIHRVKKKGEGPGLYGNWNPIGIAFGPKGERVAELPFTIFTFDSEFELLNQQRIQSPLPIRGFGPMGRTEYFQHQDSTYYLVGPSNYLSAHYLIRDEEGRDTLQNFYQINIQSGEMKSVVPYRENSPYFSSENIYQELMTKSFLVNHQTNELILLHAIENEIEIYELPSLALKGTIPIIHEEFVQYPPLPMDTPGNDERLNTLRFMAGRNQSLIQLSDAFYLIQYFKGISEAEYQARKGNDALYSPTFDVNEKAIILIKDQKQLPYELPAIQGTLLFGLGENKFLVQEPENPEIEEEVTRFSIYQIQTK